MDAGLESSASLGKRQEFLAIAKLIELGFDVYLTLVDNKQIDCVIRKENDHGEKPDYIDIQIKTRGTSKTCKPKYAATFSALEIRNPRPGFFFIFYSEQAKHYWVMPSLQLIEEANQSKSGKNAGKYAIRFTNYSSKTGLVRPRPRFEQYRDNFNLLKTLD